MTNRNQELNDENSVLIRLKGGSSVRIPRKYKYEECTCGKKDIVWGQTLKNKKPIPLRWTENKGWITHFEDCPLARKFRKKGFSITELLVAITMIIFLIAGTMVAIFYDAKKHSKNIDFNIGSKDLYEQAQEVCEYGVKSVDLVNHKFECLDKDIE